MDKQNSDNVLGNPNFPHSNVKSGISFNTFITSQQVINTESIVSINDERTCQNNISEEISSH